MNGRGLMDNVLEQLAVGVDHLPVLVSRPIQRGSRPNFLTSAVRDTAEPSEGTSSRKVCSA